MSSISRGLVVAATVALSLFGGPAGAAENWGDVVRKAQAEGSVVFYASSNAGYNERITAAFSKKYGIDVQFVGGRGNEFAERIRTEQIAGRFAADVTVNGGDTLVQHLTEGNLQPHGGLPSVFAITPAIPTEAPDAIVPVFRGYYSLLINTNLVPKDREPKSWQDLLDPAWKGRIIMDDPRVISSGSTRLRTMVAAFGKSYEERLRANDPLPALNIGDARQRVARGEFAILLPDALITHIRNVADGNPLPVKIIVPSEGSVFTTFSGAVLRNAPHPNAARVFLDFLLSPEAQLIYAEAGYTPFVTKGVLDKLPDYMQTLLSAPAMTVKELMPARDGLKLAAEIYGGR